MILYLFLSATLSLLAYLAYRHYQDRVARSSRLGTSYRRAAKVHFYGNASSVGNRSSNQSDLSLNGTLPNTSHDSSRIVTSPASFAVSPSSFGLRNRSTSSRVSFILPNSIYGYMPKTGIKSDKSRELTREFKVKLSPFPQPCRSFGSPRNVSQELSNGQSTVQTPPTSIGNNLLVTSHLNDTSAQVNRGTPIQASNFACNRSYKRPISLNDSDEQVNNDALFKKSKSLLNEDVICENDELLPGFSGTVIKKAQKRNATECENQVGVKRIKNNEIFSSYSSNLAYHNFNKRKFSPEFATSIEKKKRTVIEELELLTSDQTSPYYGNVYCSTGNVASKTTTSTDSPVLSKLDFELTHDTSEEITLECDSNTEQIIGEGNDVENISKEDAIIQEEVEKDERLYPIPTHVHSLKDHEYDRQKTKNRLGRFLAAVQQANQENEEPSGSVVPTRSKLVTLIQPARFPITTTVTSTVTPITTTIVLASEDTSKLQEIKPVESNFKIPLISTESSIATTCIASTATASSAMKFDFSSSNTMTLNTFSCPNMTNVAFNSVYALENDTVRRRCSGTSNTSFTLPKLTLNLPLNTDVSTDVKNTFVPTVSSIEEKSTGGSVVNTTINSTNATSAANSDSTQKDSNTLIQATTASSSSGFMFNLSQTTTPISNTNKSSVTFGQSNVVTTTSITNTPIFNFSLPLAASTSVSSTDKVSTLGQIPSTNLAVSSKSLFNFGQNLTSTANTNKILFDQTTSAISSPKSSMLNIGLPNTNSSVANTPAKFNFPSSSTTKSNVTSNDKPFKFGQTTNFTAPLTSSLTFNRCSLTSSNSTNSVPVLSPSSSTLVTSTPNFGQSSTTASTNSPSLFNIGQSSSDTARPAGISFGQSNRANTSSQSSSLFSFGQVSSSQNNAVPASSGFGSFGQSSNNINNITTPAMSSTTSSVFNFGQTNPAPSQQSSMFKATMTNTGFPSNLFNSSTTNIFPSIPKASDNSSATFKPASITLPNFTANTANVGFNFTAALNPPGNFNFASTQPSNSTSSNSTPFNATVPSSNFNFGSASSNSSSLFQFNSK